MGPLVAVAGVACCASHPCGSVECQVLSSDVAFAGAAVGHGFSGCWLCGLNPAPAGHNSSTCDGPCLICGAKRGANGNIKHSKATHTSHVCPHRDQHPWADVFGFRNAPLPAWLHTATPAQSSGASTWAAHGVCPAAHVAHALLDAGVLVSEAALFVCLFVWFTVFQ